MPFSPPCWSPTWAWSCLFCSNARMVSSSVLCWRIRSWKIAHFVEWRWTCVGLAHFIYSFILVLNVLWAWGMKIPLFRCGLVSLVWPPFLSGVVSATAEALSALEVPRRKELSVHCPIVLFIPLLCCWFRQVTSVPTRKHHRSEASCTLLHMAQPHVLLELWPPASQALVSFAQVPWMKLHCRAGPWCLGRGPGRWILFPPTAAFSGGQPVECFPSFLLRSYCPTKLFTQKLFSQPLLWGESKPRDQ